MPYVRHAWECRGDVTRTQECLCARKEGGAWERMPQAVDIGGDEEGVVNCTDNGPMEDSVQFVGTDP